MKLKVDQTVIVFLGSFNPRLFHPAWLQSSGVLTSKEAEAALTGDEPKDSEDTEDEENAPINLIVTKEVAQILATGLQITVQSNRLEIIALTQERHQRCFEIAVALQRLLPHSPVNALGLNRNFVIDVESETTWHSIGDTILPKIGFWAANGKSPGTVNTTVRYKECPVVDAQLNLSIGPVMERNQPLVRVNCNYHFDHPSPRAKREEPAARSEMVIPKGGFRFIDFEKALTVERWNAMCVHAFSIAERTYAVGSKANV